VPSVEKIKSSLIKEIPRHIPLNIEDIYFDWQIIGDFKPGHVSEILIGAAPKKMVDDYSDILKTARLIPLALEIEAAPITRCLINEEIKDGPRVIIDMGAIRTGFILYNNKTVQFSVSLPISGNQITEKIASALKLDLKKAEKAKITCGLDEKKCAGAIKKVLISTVNNLINKIDETIDFYQEHFQTKGEIKKIILTGGGSNLINIDKIIADKMKIPVVLGNPLTKIAAIDKSISLTPVKLQSFSTAIGLALRVFQNDNIV
jgi:type IV pilus assembly protein PilM